MTINHLLQVRIMSIHLQYPYTVLVINEHQKDVRGSVFDMSAFIYLVNRVILIKKLSHYCYVFTYSPNVCIYH